MLVFYGSLILKLFVIVVWKFEREKVTNIYFIIFRVKYIAKSHALCARSQKNCKSFYEWKRKFVVTSHADNSTEK